MSIRALTPDLEEIAKKELNEDPTRLTEDLQHIKDWISKQPHIKARKDDQWLIAFLRGCKYSLERAKSKIDLFYTLRTALPDLTLGVRLSHPNIEELIDIMPVILPKTAGPGQPRVFILRPGDHDLNKFSMSEVMCTSYLQQQLLLMEDDVSVVAGVRIIMDLEGVTVAHFAAMSPTFTKKLVTLGQDAAPLRLKGSHYINTPTGFETVFNIMKTFLNEKNKSRIHVHNKNYEEMYEFVPREILPTEYGGEGGSISEMRDIWKKKILAKADFFEEELDYKTDESKRPGKPVTSEEMFGVEGSFRQLHID